MRATAATEGDADMVQVRLWRETNEETGIGQRGEFDMEGEDAVPR